MARFNLLNFNDNIRVSLSRKKIGVPPKKFTTEKLRICTINDGRIDGSINIRSFADVTFIICSFAAATFMIISMITKFNDKTSDVLNILTPITFVLSVLTLVFLILKRKDRMTWWNFGLWIFNVLIWGMDTFNFWIYSN
jgi:hypothetical protein